MLLLDAVDKSIELTPGWAAASAECAFTASYVDMQADSFAAGASDGATDGASAVTVVPSPASGTVRQVKQITVYNHDSFQAALAVRLNHGGALRTAWRGTLLSGQHLVYLDRAGWMTLSAHGVPVRSASVNGFFRQVGPSVVDRASSQRTLFDRCANFLLAMAPSKNAVYTRYIGRAKRDFTVAHVELQVTVGGVGAQVAEVGLAVGDAPMIRRLQRPTVVAVSGAVDDLTTAGIKRNTSPLSYTVTAGTHLWAFFRSSMATTQPTVVQFTESAMYILAYGSGRFGYTGAMASALVVGDTFLVNPNCYGPELRVTLD